MAIIGIDLGTTNSLVTYWDHGVKLIPNEFGEYLTPSVVGFDENQEVLVGKAAREMLVTYPERTFREFKRDMGTTVKKQVDGKSYLPEELSALVLRQLKHDAEKYLQCEVTEAVISVPAYFSDKQRCATRNAGRLAGLTVHRIINEPSAAALAYHIENMTDYAKYLIFDFGGGTLDISIVEVFDNVVEIKAVAGDNQLGGKDFNELIVTHFCEQNHINKYSLSKQNKEYLYREAEEIKMQLSEKEQVKRVILLDGKECPYRIDKKELKKIAVPLFTRMLEPVQQVISMEEMSIGEIDQVLLVGGSSKMPLVQEFLKSIFGEKVYTDLNPDEIVALGVGTVVGIKERKVGVADMLLSDICPFTLGVEVSDGTISAIIEKNESLPCSRTKEYRTLQDNQKIVLINVYQGEKLIASQNNLLRKIELDILPKPKGYAPILVTFSYDINGIFDIDVESEEYGLDLHESMIGKDNGLSEQEMEERREKLKEMKEKQESKVQHDYLVFRANRIAISSSLKNKNLIVMETQRYMEAQKVIEDPLKRREFQVYFSLFLDKMEKELTTFDISGFWEEEEV